MLTPYFTGSESHTKTWKMKVTSNVEMQTTQTTKKWSNIKHTKWKSNQPQKIKSKKAEEVKSHRSQKVKVTQNTETESRTNYKKRESHKPQEVENTPNTENEARKWKSKQKQETTVTPHIWSKSHPKRKRRKTEVNLCVLAAGTEIEKKTKKNREKKRIAESSKRTLQGKAGKFKAPVHLLR